MPITFSVTCDSDIELARFLEHLKLGAELAYPAGSRTAVSVKPAVKSAERPSTNGRSAQKQNKNTGKASTAKTPRSSAAKTVVAVKAKTAAPRGGSRSISLHPIIEKGINDVVRKGKPFRSRDVVDQIMKHNPALNENSVITGVSKQLSESPLKFDQIRDTVGRPYRMYKP